MAILVKIADIVGALQIRMEGWDLFLNKQTGSVVHISEDAFRDLDEEDDDNHLAPQESIEEAKKIKQNPEDYIALPDQFEINEWKMMENFAFAQNDEKMNVELQQAIRGQGAFRYFKDTIQRLGISEDWYRFREQAYAQMAREWCEDNGFQIQ